VWALLHDSSGNTVYTWLQPAQERHGRLFPHGLDRQHLVPDRWQRLGIRTGYRFDAFGNQSVGAGIDQTSLKFAGAWGYQSDVAMHLQLLGARYYDPEVGRFLSPDPIGFLDGLNLYAYCGNNPVGLVDPLGLSPEDGEYWLTRIVNTIRPAAALEQQISAWVPVGIPGAGGVGTMLVGLHDSWDAWGTAEGTPGTGVGALWMARGNAGLQTLGAATLAGGGVACGLGRAGRGLSVASGSGGGTRQAAVVRQIQRGEKLADIVNEMKALTWTTGVEHAIISLRDGARMIVSGGPSGIILGNLPVRRIILHTHPYGVKGGPSPMDFLALRKLRQTKSYILEAGETILFRRR
jgi:RHS repeat-associated protein